jgi:O-antigen ligase
MLLASSFTTQQAIKIAHAFAASCIILLVLSFASLFWPTGPWEWFKEPGVPVKDNAVQSTCFALCAFGFGLYSAHFFRIGSRPRGIATSLLALLLFVDVFLIHLSKTGALITIALAAFLLVRMLRWRDRLGVAILLVLLATLAISFSSEAQRRVAEIGADLRAMEGSSSASKHHNQIDSVAGTATISTASRIDFWQKAVEFIKAAPLFGHGAGSTKSLYASLERERPSPYGEAVPDPHNQFFAIAIQAGLIGGFVLLMMWVVHFRLMWGESAIHLLGQAVVLQNVLGSLFNSSLSQVTQGTLYCLAVGILGALIRQNR